MSQQFLPRTSYAPIAALLVPLLACSGGSSESESPDGGITEDPGSTDSGTTADGGVVGSEYVDLITGTWSKGGGSDSYWCSSVTVKEDMYITGFEAIAPLGTHHTVLSVSDTGTDGEKACRAGMIADQMLFASGVGTATYDLPTGVAVPVKAGQVLHLNLHLFNASDSVLTGVSGTRVKTIPQEEVVHLAEFFLAGTLAISIPGSGEDHLQSTSCTIQGDGNIFTLWPHMHQIGKQMKITHKGSVLLDTPYSFNEQKMHPIADVPVTDGDKVEITCTWNNPLGNPTKTFGDGSNDEMCFGGIYKYPATGVSAFCYN